MRRRIGEVCDRLIADARNWWSDTIADSPWVFEDEYDFLEAMLEDYDIHPLYIPSFVSQLLEGLSSNTFYPDDSDFCNPDPPYPLVATALSLKPRKADTDNSAGEPGVESVPAVFPGHSSPIMISSNSCSTSDTDFALSGFSSTEWIHRVVLTSDHSSSTLPTTEPARTETSETKPARTESPETKPARTENSETQPARTETSEPQPARTETSETPPARTETSETQPAHTETSETQSARTEVSAYSLADDPVKMSESAALFSRQSVLEEVSAVTRRHAALQDCKANHNVPIKASVINSAASQIYSTDSTVFTALANKHAAYQENQIDSIPTMASTQSSAASLGLSEVSATFTASPESNKDAIPAIVLANEPAALLLLPTKGVLFEAPAERIAASYLETIEMQPSHSEISAMQPSLPLKSAAQTDSPDLVAEDQLPRYCADLPVAIGSSELTLVVGSSE